jgi:hypothetical protein
MQILSHISKQEPLPANHRWVENEHREEVVSKDALGHQDCALNLSPGQDDEFIR